MWNGKDHQKEDDVLDKYVFSNIILTHFKINHYPLTKSIHVYTYIKSIIYSKDTFLSKW